MADSFLGREGRMNEFAMERPRISDKRRRGREKIRSVLSRSPRKEGVSREKK